MSSGRTELWRGEARVWALGALGVVACSAMAMWGYARSGLGPLSADTPALPWIAAWSRWDSGWYAEIVRNGYWYRPGEQSPVAFFPAYPLLVRALTAAGLNLFTAGVLLTSALGMAGLFLVHRWARTLADGRTAWIATLLLAVYPFSYYLYGAMYSDALFLVAAAGAFLALERDRPWTAAVLGMVATACRPIAPAVVLGLLARQIERRLSRGERIRLVDVVPGLSGAGLLLYMAFLHVQVGDALAFVHVQTAAHWAQPPGWQTWLKVDLFRTLFPRVPFWLAVRLLGHALVALAALALVWPTWRRIGWGYAVYVGVAVGIPAISTKDFMGTGRYLIAAFPIFLTLALLLRERPRVLRRWVAASGIILLLLAMAFGAGEYVS